MNDSFRASKARSKAVLAEPNCSSRWSPNAVCRRLEYIEGLAFTKVRLGRRKPSEDIKGSREHTVSDPSIRPCHTIWCTRQQAQSPVDCQAGAAA
jgi:hypothetical protein